MNPIKIFDRESIHDSTDYNNGLIHACSIFQVIDVQNIIREFIENSEIFKIIVYTASKILNIHVNELVTFNIEGSRECHGWLLHPILIKSILRHVESLTLRKLQIIREINNKCKRIGIDVLYNYPSLVSIVENVKYPCTIEHPRYRGYAHLTKKYKCKGILNKDDMFDDDILISKCVIYISVETLILFLPQCLCDIICSYF
jgi:hypothetical protein